MSDNGVHIEAPAAADAPAAPRRPVYLDLLRIHEPIPAIVSILHRVSGAALFLIGIPLALYAVRQSLASADAYASLQAMLARPVVKIVLLALVWAYLHHFCAGVRHLLLDLHVGTDLKPARQSGVAVLIASLALAAIIGARLW